MCSMILGPATKPSLVTWPTMNTGILRIFALRRMRLLVSRNCVMLPGSESRLGRLTDWMDYIASAVPIKLITAENTENLYRAHLTKKYGSIEKPSLPAVSGDLLASRKVGAAAFHWKAVTSTTTSGSPLVSLTLFCTTTVK